MLRAFQCRPTTAPGRVDDGRDRQDVVRPERVLRIGTEDDIAAVALRARADRLSFGTRDLDRDLQQVGALPARIEAGDREFVEEHDVLRAQPAIGRVDQAEHVVHVGAHRGVAVGDVDGTHSRLDDAERDVVLGERDAGVGAVGVDQCFGSHAGPLDLSAPRVGPHGAPRPAHHAPAAGWRSGPGRAATAGWRRTAGAACDRVATRQGRGTPAARSSCPGGRGPAARGRCRTAGPSTRG